MAFLCDIRVSGAPGMGQGERMSDQAHLGVLFPGLDHHLAGGCCGRNWSLGALCGKGKCSTKMQAVDPLVVFSVGVHFYFKMSRGKRKRKV